MAELNTVRNMHYDFKQKLNKIDSQQFRNFKVPEIDWKLNEALFVFIKIILKKVGAEADMTLINDIRNIVMEGHEIDVVNKFAILPENFLFHLASKSRCTKSTCTVDIINTVQRHGSKFIEDKFTESSFEWRDVNITFTEDKIHVYDDNTFSVSKVILDYVRKPLYIHTAIDSAGGKYNLPDGTELTGFQNCELPVFVHGDIVDLAVLITTGDLISDYQSKYSKIQLTN